MSKVIWDFLLDKIGNAYGVAGLMGNLFAESGLRPNNLENIGNNSLGMSDEDYTRAVDNGSYTNFTRDGLGYGLAQWTFWSRKQTFLDYVKSKGTSVSDLTTQLEFLIIELGTYKGVLNTLRTAKSVREASDCVLCQYERPADQSESAKVKRASYGQKYYDEYATECIEDVTYITYEIVSGDNLSSIAKRYGTTVDAIVEANGIVNKNIIYVGDEIKIPVIQATATKSIDELAKEVIAGKWGVGADRKDRLTKAGYNYSTVQARVNELLS